jgi:hypothetical protein
MGYSKANEIDKDYLVRAALPNYGDTYTVISHQYVINTTKQMLANSGFVIEKETYIANRNARVAQGIYYIRPINSNDKDIQNETELGMMFAWTNSYDKSTKFQCAVGARVFVCSNGMLCGEIDFARKHTGSADVEVRTQISNQLKRAELAFKDIIKDVNALKQAPLSQKKQAELMGRLFVNDMLGPRQMQIVKQEMDKPSYNYGDRENAWAFYNHVTHALKTTHPRSWLSDTKNFHDFMSAEVLTQMGVSIPNEIPADEIDLQDIQDVQDEMSSAIEDPIAKEWDQQTRDDDGDDEPVNDSPEITGIPDGDKLSDADDEFDADAEMQEIKTEQVIDEREESFANANDFEIEEDDSWIEI